MRKSLIVREGIVVIMMGVCVSLCEKKVQSPAVERATRVSLLSHESWKLIKNARYECAVRFFNSACFLHQSVRSVVPLHVSSIWWIA